MLNDEAAIDDVNPFVTYDFSLPGSVRQTGDFANFSEMKEENVVAKTEKSVFCDYALCEDSTSSCSFSRPLQPIRNIDYGFTKDRKNVIETIKIGVAKNPQFSMIGGWISLMSFIMIVYHLRR
jgi:hypothetical protein|tara:strand:+ start:1061 stop:1429 length:369 start_codon:yes stop_codon:yes gene_type:complete